jgi:putative hydrolase of the HAD superfamily
VVTAEVDAVLLDAGGVLLLPGPEEFRTALAPLGIVPDAERCRRAHYVGMREVDRLGAADWIRVDRVVARELGVPDERLDETTEAIGDVYTRLHWEPIPGAAEALRAFQAAGLALAVVSNAEGTMEEQLATHEICSVRGGAAAQVAVVIDSAVVGIEKPDPRIFQLALDAIEVPPERCLYVGDSFHFDVEGARAAGLVPVHMDPYDLCGHDDHAHIHSLDELVEILAPAEETG